jgi:hypothetical protein
MLLPLAFGVLLLVVNVTVQAVATAVIVRLAARLIRRGYAGHSFWRNVIIMQVVTLLLLASSLLQMTLWAVLFVACGEFRHFDTAFYFSAVNFTTLGYGDIVMSEAWRLLGPLEAVNGVLMFGLSASVLFAVLSRLMQQRLRELGVPPDDAG